MIRNRKSIFVAAVLMGFPCWNCRVHAFSFEDPAGPQFAEEQKQTQREAGKAIVPLVADACRNGLASVRIPPGNYRFGRAAWGRDGVIYPLEFSGLRRTAQNPLTIDATDVTLWFDLGEDQAPAAQAGVGFKNCRHIIFQGATIDRGSRGNFEGKITQIDLANQRLEIQLSPGILMPKTFNGQLNQRLIPFKSDGRFCAPLYALQGGGLRLTYQTPLAGTAPGRVWIPLASPALLETMRQPQWVAAYGKLGVLEIGDGIACIYSTAQAISLVDSESLTMRGIKIHMAKGGVNETGGQGGHLWTCCYFGPRPGTSQWQGGDGMMLNATRRGTTLDRVTIVHSTDDPVNIHGYWSEVGTVSYKKVVFLTNKPTDRLLRASVACGDRLRFYKKTTGALVGCAAITALDGDTVTLDCPAMAFADALAEWEDHQCAGWTIRDCEFRDCYQRLVIKSGPGTIRNCVFARLGNGIQLASVLPYVEGGVPRGIVIAGNTFDDVNPQPLGAAINVYAHAYDRAAAPWMSDVTITNNLFRIPGDTAIALSRVNGVRVSGNRIERRGLWAPVAGAAKTVNQRDAAMAVKPTWADRLGGTFHFRSSLKERIPGVESFAEQSILLDRCRNIVVQDNQVLLTEETLR